MQESPSHCPECLEGQFAKNIAVHWQNSGGKENKDLERVRFVPNYTASMISACPINVNLTQEHVIDEIMFHVSYNVKVNLKRTTFEKREDEQQW